MPPCSAGDLAHRHQRVGVDPDARAARSASWRRPVRRRPSRRGPGPASPRARHSRAGRRVSPWTWVQTWLEPTYEPTLVLMPAGGAARRSTPRSAASARTAPPSRLRRRSSSSRPAAPCSARRRPRGACRPSGCGCRRSPEPRRGRLRRSCAADVPRTRPSGGDPAVANAEVGVKRRVPGAVDHAAASDDEIELGARRLRQVEDGQREKRGRGGCSHPTSGPASCFEAAR